MGFSTLAVQPHPVEVSAEPISVLAVASSDHARKLESIVEHTRWRLRVVHSIHDALLALRSEMAGVVLCEEVLEDGHWSCLAAEARHLCPPPQIIVLSLNFADPAFWRHAIETGAYQLLPWPPRDIDLYEAVPHAWRKHHRSSPCARACAGCGD